MKKLLLLLRLTTALQVFCYLYFVASFSCYSNEKTENFTNKELYKIAALFSKEAYKEDTPADQLSENGWIVTYDSFNKKKKKLKKKSKEFYQKKNFRMLLRN